MRDHTQDEKIEATTNPVVLWGRSIENLRAARRQVPIMMDFEGRDGLARDTAAEAYVIAAEALVTDLGALLELGYLERIAESMAATGGWPTRG